MTPVQPTFQSIRPADAIETPSVKPQKNEQEEHKMCNSEQKQKSDSGRDEIIESLLEGKTPEGFIEITSDLEADDGEGSE